MASKLIIFGVSIVLISAVVNSETKSVTVETPNGKLEGLEFLSRNGRPYSAFRGVPYGKKPKRFQLSVPYPPWTDVKKATEFGNVCPQYDMAETKSIIGDENCLFLNVFSPKTSNTGEKKPVIVWFHHGAFVMGKSNDYDGKYFMDCECVILVTVNYRLGALGFLYLEDDSVPGNLGLKDQHLALKWIQDNIESFGGDKTKVTIGGSAAGAASVHLHLLSKMSKGLFQNGISQSGSALCPWAIQKSPEASAIILSQILECPTDDFSTLLFCLTKKSIEEIIEAQIKMNQWFLFPINHFAPVVELKTSPEPKFLTDEPENLLSSGNFNQVPWITGFNEDEGVYLSTPILLNDNMTKELSEKWNRVAPIMLLYNDIYPLEKRENISDKILKFYFGDEDVGEETWSSLTDLISDRYTMSPIDQSARLHAKYSKVYPYVLSFPGGDPTGVRSFWGLTGEHGVGHLDELQYQFNGILGSPEYVKDTQHEPLEFSQRFVKLWTSFAQNSEPTAIWKDVTEWKPIPSYIGNSSINYLEIAQKLKISDTDFDDRFKFWNDLSLDRDELEAEIISGAKDEL